MEVVRADGELVTISRAHDPATFPGAVVSLGCAGRRHAADARRSSRRYDVRQWVYEDLEAGAFREHVDELTAAGDSVSGFTHWRGRGIEQVWVKRRVPAGRRGSRAAADAVRRATGDRRPPPDPGLSPDAATPQLGVAGAMARAAAALPP